MFRKIVFATVSLSLLLGLLILQNKAYSYPTSEGDEGMGPVYNVSSNESSDTPIIVSSAEQVAVSQPPVTQYQVTRGDTLFKIARSFDISVDDLIHANDMSNPNQLTIGQTLTIPVLTTTDGQPKIIKKVLNTTLTAYTAGFESTGKRASHPTYGITYSGIKAREGRTIAVDPNVIPLGSTVFIEGIGLRKAEDIGSAIRGSRIDVFMNDLGQAQEFGVKKNVKVYLLDRENV
ncbi:3D domain-containing protein [Paenibacillus roseipurpureus]|uniref:3D domain-containing protein n=1 Tax=Paenibacillus roseopurpureus TaxID=2918901 RepID=A0AA96RL49_9BACL|nr:3D domain-containing protein [Paenibacillus sp. MBLB1832]WNR44991.1 3D domain-containing protein [Paenibacillus sp. MBLB1832]